MIKVYAEKGELILIGGDFPGGLVRVPAAKIKKPGEKVRFSDGHSYIEHNGVNLQLKFYPYRKSFLCPFIELQLLFLGWRGSIERVEGFYMKGRLNNFFEVQAFDMTGVDEYCKHYQEMLYLTQ